MKIKIIYIMVVFLFFGFSVISATGDNQVDNEIKKDPAGKGDYLDYWTEQEKLLSSDSSIGDYFGSSVSIYGNYAIIGAPEENSGVGSAYIFSRSGSNWIEEQKITASDGEAGDNFGCSVAIYENLAIVGASGDDDSTGSAYLFNYSGSSWIEEQKLTASDGEIGDNLGRTVSINKNLAIVGAPSDNNNKGTVYCYNYSNTNGTEFIKLEAPDGEINNHFGCSIAYDGRFVIIGAYGDNSNSGSAYILEYCCYFKWREKVNVSTSLPYFGWSVSIEGDYAIIGAPGLPDSDSKGSVYIFKRDENNWFEHTFWDGIDDGEYLGRSVSIDGAHAIASANDDTNIGSAYIFRRNGSIWEREQKITALDGEPGDSFGISVSIDAGYILVGAVGDEGYTGSAYVFMKRGVPDLSIQIIGGFGANIVVTNNGENDTEDFDVKVLIHGGIFKMVNKSYDFTISLSAGETKELTTGIFFGIGKVYITATTDFKDKTVFALQLGIYTFIQ